MPIASHIPLRAGDIVMVRCKVDLDFRDGKTFSADLPNNGRAYLDRKDVDLVEYAIKVGDVVYDAAKGETTGQVLAVVERAAWVDWSDGGREILPVYQLRRLEPPEPPATTVEAPEAPLGGEVPA